MKKIHGHCWLAIATCLCILVSLGYVNLFRGLTTKVNDPSHAQFWQLRTVGLQLRDAEAEAHEAFLKGAYQPFDSKSLASTTDHWAAESYERSATKSNAVPTRFASFQSAKPVLADDHASKVNNSHMAYQKVVHHYTLAYNAELTRLMNGGQ